MKESSGKLPSMFASTSDEDHEKTQYVQIAGVPVDFRSGYLLNKMEQRNSDASASPKRCLFAAVTLTDRIV
jgi:hypothetical protein